MRSGCPINQTLETIGDRWSLIVVRDIMFGNRRHYRDMLDHSEERIASNILSDRLKRLVKGGLLTKNTDSTHRQRFIYSLTEKSIQLLPILVHMGAWGRRHCPVTGELSARAELLETGGPDLWEDLMKELRAIHIGGPSPKRSVIKELDAAYQASVGERSNSP